MLSSLLRSEANFVNFTFLLSSTKAVVSHGPWKKKEKREKFLPQKSNKNFLGYIQLNVFKFALEQTCLSMFVILVLGKVLWDMQQWPISKTLGEREEIETERKIEEERQRKERARNKVLMFLERQVLLGAQIEIESSLHN